MICIAPSLVSPSLSVAITVKSNVIASLPFWPIGPRTVTLYEPSVSIVTVITAPLSLSKSVKVLPSIRTVVASPLLVTPLKLGCSSVKLIVSIASEPTSSGILPEITSPLSAVSLIVTPRSVSNNGSAPSVIVTSILIRLFRLLLLISAP